MTLERLILLALLFTLAASTVFVVRRRSPLDPSILLVVTTALVGGFYPLGSAFVKPLTWRHGAHLPEEVVLATTMQYLAFAVGVSLVVANIRWRRNSNSPSNAAATRRGESDPYTRFRDTVIATGLVGGGALLYAIYVQKVGIAPLLDRHNFAEKYRVSSGLGIYYIGLNLVIVGCLWAESSSLSRRATSMFRALAALVLLWAVAFVAVRTYAVAVVLGYLYLACRRSGYSIARIRPWLVIALGLGYVAVESYAMLRGAWRGSIVEAIQTVQHEQLGLERSLGQVVGGSELSHPFLTTMELAQYEEAGALRGSSYAEALLGILPVWLIRDRPPTPAQEFARRHYPSLEARGGGTAFSIVGEAWWNLGSLVGPFLAGLAIAALFRRLERTGGADASSAVAKLLPYLVHMVILLHRGSAVSIAKHLFSILLPIAALSFVAWLVWHAVGARSNRRNEPNPGPTRLQGSV